MEPDYFEEGREAHMEGHQIFHCPYSIGSRAAREWEAGWISADEEDI